MPAILHFGNKLAITQLKEGEKLSYTGGTISVSKPKVSPEQFALYALTSLFPEPFLTESECRNGTILFDELSVVYRERCTTCRQRERLHWTRRENAQHSLDNRTNRCRTSQEMLVNWLRSKYSHGASVSNTSYPVTVPVTVPWIVSDILHFEYLSTIGSALIIGALQVYI